MWRRRGRVCSTLPGRITWPQSKRRWPGPLLTFYRKIATLLFITHRSDEMAENKSEILQGTLDLMVLKTLEAMGPLHGYGIARCIEQVSQDDLALNQGTSYASLVLLKQL